MNSFNQILKQIEQKLPSDLTRKTSDEERKRIISEAIGCNLINASAFNEQVVQGIQLLGIVVSKDKKNQQYICQPQVPAQELNDIILAKKFKPVLEVARKRIFGLKKNEDFIKRFNNWLFYLYRLCEQSHAISNQQASFYLKNKPDPFKNFIDFKNFFVSYPNQFGLTIDILKTEVDRNFYEDVLDKTTLVGEDLIKYMKKIFRHMKQSAKGKTNIKLPIKDLKLPRSVGINLFANRQLVENKMKIDETFRMLRMLIFYINFFSEHLGCPKNQALKYILEGRLPKYSATVTSYEFSGQAYAVIRISDKSLTIKDLANFYKEVRAKIGLARKKSLNQKHLAIYKFVKSQKNRTWPEIKVLWNKKYPQWQYSDNSSLRVAYRRIKQRTGEVIDN